MSHTNHRYHIQESQSSTYIVYQFFLSFIVHFQRFYKRRGLVVLLRRRGCHSNNPSLRFVSRLYPIKPPPPHHIKSSPSTSTNANFNARNEPFIISSTTKNQHPTNPHHPSFHAPAIFASRSNEKWRPRSHPRRTPGRSTRAGAAAIAPARRWKSRLH